MSSLSLAVLLGAVFLSVIMRYVFGAPILGANEIAQLVSVALVMTAMPVAAYQDKHVRVDVLDPMIGPVGQAIGDILSRSLAVFLLCMLCYRGWLKMLDAAEFGDATNMLAVPIWPFYGLLVLGAALYAALLAIELVDLLRGRFGRHG